MHFNFYRKGADGMPIEEFTFTGALAGNAAAAQYFQSLPDFVQETIKQSGIQFENEQHLHDVADHLMKSN